MRNVSRKALAISVLTASAASMDANALPLTGWYATNGSGVVADWSSDFGLAYNVGPNGIKTGTGLVSPTPWVTPGDSYLAPNSTFTASVSRNLLGGDVAGSITAQTGSYGAIGPSVVHNIGFSFDLSNPAYCCGYGASGMFQGIFEFDRGTLNANNSVPQYWVAEYTIDVVNPGTGYFLDFDAYFWNTKLLPSKNPTTGRYTGTLSGAGNLPWQDSFCFGSIDVCSRSYWQFIIGGGLAGGGLYGNASLDINFALAFSDSPFERIVYPEVNPEPTPGPVGVPEPQSLALIGAGLFGMAMMRRRQRRANDCSLSYSF